MPSFSVTNVITHLVLLVWPFNTYHCENIRGFTFHIYLKNTAPRTPCFHPRMGAPCHDTLPFPLPPSPIPPSCIIYLPALSLLYMSCSVNDVSYCYKCPKRRTGLLCCNVKLVHPLRHIMVLAARLHNTQGFVLSRDIDTSHTQMKHFL